MLSKSVTPSQIHRNGKPKHKCKQWLSTPTAPTPPTSIFAPLWGRLQEGFSFPKQCDGITLPWPVSVVAEAEWPLGWTSACLPHRGVACCCPKPWSQGGRWEWRSFTDRGRRNAMSSFPKWALGDFQLKFSVVPLCSQLIRSTPTLTLWTQSRSITPKTTLSLLLLMRSLEFCNLCNFFGDVLQINNLFWIWLGFLVFSGFFFWCLFYCCCWGVFVCFCFC